MEDFDLPDNNEFLSEFQSFLQSQFDVVELLRERPLSIVLRARDFVDGQDVAIKGVRFQSATHRLAYLEKQKTFYSRAEFRHHNLVEIRRLGADPGRNFYYVVMEYVPGPTLSRYFIQQENRLTIGAVLDILRQVARGIDALHGEGFIHRDLKPDNIFINNLTRATKIGDFGLIVAVEEMGIGPVEESCGTPAFIAPEQIIGTGYGQSVDIYAFAMTIYSLLTRCLPFDVYTTQDLLYAHINSPAIPMRRRNRSWPSELDAAIMKSVSKIPYLRHPSAMALMDDVSRALETFTPFRLSSFFDGSLSLQSGADIPVNF